MFEPMFLLVLSFAFSVAEGVPSPTVCCGAKSLPRRELLVLVTGRTAVRSSAWRGSWYRPIPFWRCNVFDFSCTAAGEELAIEKWLSFSTRGACLMGRLTGEDSS